MSPYVRTVKTSPGSRLPVTAARTSELWDGLAHGGRVLGFGEAARGDAVCAQLVLARISEPAGTREAGR